MKKLNEREKQFLQELQELLKKYNVSIEGTEYSNWSGGGCSGIDFYGNAKPLNEDIPYRENVVDIELDGRYLTWEDIEEILKTQRK